MHTGISVHGSYFRSSAKKVSTVVNIQVLFGRYIGLPTVGFTGIAMMLKGTCWGVSGHADSGVEIVTGIALLVNARVLLVWLYCYYVPRKDWKPSTIHILLILPIHFSIIPAVCASPPKLTYEFHSTAILLLPSTTKRDRNKATSMTRV